MVEAELREGHLPGGAGKAGPDGQAPSTTRAKDFLKKPRKKAPAWPDAGVQRAGDGGEAGSPPTALLIPMERKLKSMSLGDFLARKFPPREYVLDPWFRKRGIVMIAGETGVGKTYFMLTVAYAIATGMQILEKNQSLRRK